jgi:hypothetical protein
VLAVEEERSRSGTSPVLAIGGGILAALVLWWLVGIVIGTVVFAIRIIVIGGLIGGALWLWGKFTSDDDD